MVVDLKGFTITGDVAASKACVVIRDGTGTYPTAIRNGTISNFANGINDFDVSNITIKNVVFDQGEAGVLFGQSVREPSAIAPSIVVVILRSTII